MFIRWRRRRRKDGRWTRSAALVHKVLTPEVPRSRHVCPLGSLDEDEPEGRARTRFWTSVRENLDRAGIVGRQRQRVVDALEKSLPMPDSRRRRGGLAD